MSPARWIAFFGSKSSIWLILVSCSFLLWQKDACLLTNAWIEHSLAFSIGLLLCQRKLHPYSIFLLWETKQQSRIIANAINNFQKYKWNVWNHFYIMAFLWT
jgi:hypothetical protein